MKNKKKRKGGQAAASEVWWSCQRLNNYALSPPAGSTRAEKVGHSTLVCPTPAERDAEGFLPYHGPHLSVPDERKNKAGTNSVQGSFSSGQGSWPGNGRNGQSSQARASAQPQGKDGNGEATSSGKPKRTRTRKPKVNAQDVAGKSLAKMQGDGNKRTGQKRKVYVPKQPVEVSPTPLVPVIGRGTLPPALSVEIGVEAESGTNSYKKHKKNDGEASSGSADQATMISP
ncbi:hypothetical protein ZWY2020_058795 [Hordeum vulgare]|nr:hypothetical protein ZWY2020_058795 [Hordeum vulgare]